VFLTGRHEIETAMAELQSISGLLPIPIYSALERHHQTKIFDEPPKGIRKVVLATNIAATSITIEGIVYVVDSGFVKQSNYNSNHGMDSLLVVPISRSAAEQR
jgi:HrpA-like RNA helicase